MPLPVVDSVVEYAQAAMPAPLWRGVTVIELDCGEDRDRLCQRFAERARIDAPLRISTAGETPTIATLRVTATFGPADGPLTLTLAAERPVSLDDAQGTLLPRRFTCAPGEAETEFLDRVLDTFLPWRRRGRGPGRMEQLVNREY